MAGGDVAEATLNITVKRKSKRKSGFEVELREDGFYYLSEVPEGCKSAGVGDRVLACNGASHTDFRSEKYANDLIDSFSLEVVPKDDDDESDESEYGSDGSYNNENIVSGEEVSSPSDEGEENDEASVEEESDMDEEWERPTGKYKSNERFMVTVTKAADGEPGISMIPFKRYFYVAEVMDHGPFYTTSVDKGDQILSINGRKTKDIRDVDHAVEIMAAKAKVTLFVCRPDPNVDQGYQYVMENV